MSRRVGGVVVRLRLSLLVFFFFFFVLILYSSTTLGGDVSRVCHI